MCVHIYIEREREQNRAKEREREKNRERDIHKATLPPCGHSPRALGGLLPPGLLAGSNMSKDDRRN